MIGEGINFSSSLEMMANKSLQPYYGDSYKILLIGYSLVGYKLVKMEDSANGNR